MAPKWDYKLTGKLQFRVDNLPYSAGIRGTWSDGKCQRLEKCIGDFIIGLRVAAAAIKKNRQETEERERRWEEERKQKEEQRRKAAEHKRKAEFVTELMRNREEAENVRTFVKELAECAGKLELSSDEKGDIQQVVDWTTKYADFLDPLSDLPDSIAEFVHPERRYPWLN
jgi:predicted ATP-dependent protease